MEQLGECGAIWNRRARRRNRFGGEIRRCIMSMLSVRWLPLRHVSDHFWIKEFLMGSFLQLSAAPVELRPARVYMLGGCGVCVSIKMHLIWVRGKVSQEGFGGRARPLSWCPRTCQKIRMMGDLISEGWEKWAHVRIHTFLLSQALYHLALWNSQSAWSTLLILLWAAPSWLSQCHCLGPLIPHRWTKTAISICTQSFGPGTLQEKTCSSVWHIRPGV